MIELTDDCRIGIARLFDKRKSTIEEEKDWIRRSIVLGVNNHPESAALNIPDEKVKENVEFRISESDDDTFVELEGYIYFGKLKLLCETGKEERLQRSRQ